MVSSLASGCARQCHRLQRTSVRRYASSASGTSVFSNPKDAEYLYSAVSPPTLRRLHGLPEIIVTGRANAGKSTLLNAILGRRDLVMSSKKPGKTRMLNFFQVGPDVGKLVLVDSPGYGARGRPEWGSLFDYYLRRREELRRVYILFNSTHGLNEADKIMLRDLDARSQSWEGNHWTFQAILTKADKATQADAPSRIAKIREEIFEAAPTCLPPIVTAAGLSPPFGIDEVRNSIAEACGIVD
ncbi:P-loop containing nucleoside triphosphate hydrolase protein [Dentipellis sp. KUC8613]|nr:P-loop containing nucleoside triphosphate hydrolase protein [Dentipellis sp. KUC8613]